jgi:hypothetical protein
MPGNDLHPDLRGWWRITVPGVTTDSGRHRKWDAEARKLARPEPSASLNLWIPPQHRPKLTLNTAGCSIQKPKPCSPRVTTRSISRASSALQAVGGALRAALPVRGRQRLGAFCARFADVVVDSLSDHAGRQLVEVGVELVGEGKELGPEGLVLECLGGADLDRTASSADITEGLESVAATQGDEESSLPRIRQAVMKPMSTSRLRSSASRARIRLAARRAASRSPLMFVPAWSASILRSFSSNVPSSGSMAGSQAQPPAGVTLVARLVRLCFLGTRRLLGSSLGCR